MDAALLMNWIHILVPVAGATVVLLMKIARLQAELEHVKEMQGLMLTDTKELLRRDVYNARQEAMEGYLKALDDRLSRIEKKLYNGSQ